MELYEKGHCRICCKIPICQQVNVENQRPKGLSQDISNAIWKWEIYIFGFFHRIPRMRHRHDLIWVIVDKIIELAHFFPFKTID